MTKCDLEKKLKKAGFKWSAGGRHDIWVKESFPPIIVPRHKGDIPVGTLKNIMKTAQLIEH